MSNASENSVGPVLRAVSQLQPHPQAEVVPGMPEEEFGDQAAIIDPADEGPRVYFQRVPERKTVKDRVHLDVRVAGREVEGEERKWLVSEKVEQLVEAGASIAWMNESVRGHSIVLRDPEGNEFCVA